MFKWKIYVYKNVNGKEEKIEREFDNPKDFQAFAQQNDVLQYEDMQMPRLWLWDRVNLNNYFEDLIDRRLGIPVFEGAEEPALANSVVDLDKYEEELQKIEYQKQHKDEHTKALKSTLQKLKDYKKQFKSEGRDDMVKQIDDDIKKVEAEIASLGK